VGQARTREEAGSIAEKLRAEGIEDLWIVEEQTALEGGGTLRLVDAEYRDTTLSPEGVWVVPLQRSERVVVEGSEYRGVLEVFIGRAGLLTVVNHLGLEEYLRGVVPNELGPGQYPEIEALKAQAVAARTYVYRNLGQFGTDGYDICDSMRCQVYKGYLSEHPLTDEAIRRTSGEILTWKDKPINALYTSACGGHTEDGHRVFEEEKWPYLKGVACYPEQEEARRTSVLLSTKRRPDAGDEARADGLYEAALLSVLGMLPPAPPARAWLDAPATTEEIRGWTVRALRAMGKRPGRHDFAAAEIGTRAALARYWVQVFGWEERAQRLMSGPDIDSLLVFDDGGQVPATDRSRVAYLVREGWYEADGRGRLRPLDAPGRAEVVRTLQRILERYDSLGLKRAEVLARDGDTLELRVAGSAVKVALGPEPFLFRQSGGRALAASELPLRPGDTIYYHAGGAGIDLLVFDDSRRGVADDRFQPNLWWEARLSREEAQRRVSRRVEVGRLVDIVPLEYGPSQRVARLKVVGSRREAILTGFKIRVALGLREDLFVIDRQYDADGGVGTFIFSGKGWGHGVGMCQNGAYGMAVRGKTYREILSHYYSGARLERRHGSS
jgi:stage II sporulation protein D